MSSEHVWGDWILRGGYVPRTMNKHSFNDVSINRPGVPNTSNVKIRAGDPLGVNIEIACKSCNNGWMSALQEKAKPFLIPLFKGDRAVLGHDAQTAIAAWAAMATMSAEYLTHDDTSIAIPQADRDYIRLNGVAPPDWRMWVGFYDRATWPAQWVHTSLPILEAQDIPDASITDPPLPNSQTTTFVIGKLYFHIMSTHFPNHARDWHWKAVPRANALLMQVWPPRHGFITWPITGLSDRDADQFSRAFFDWADGIARMNNF